MSPLTTSRLYDRFESLRGYRQDHRINHSEKVYVVGETGSHAVRRGILVACEARDWWRLPFVSRQYLQTYLDEYTFRYNRRFDLQPMFTSFLHQVRKALPASHFAKIGLKFLLRKRWLRLSAIPEKEPANCDSFAYLSSSSFRYI